MSLLGTYNVEIDVNDIADKMAEPPKRWRNWYRARHAFLCATTGPHEAGDLFKGSRVWPTKDIAETKAVQNRYSSAVVGGSEYLGAEPEA